MKEKEESGKAGLQPTIKTTKMMAFNSIVSRHINEDKTESVTDFIFLTSDITVGIDYSHETKRLFSLDKKLCLIYSIY